MTTSQRRRLIMISLCCVLFCKSSYGYGFLDIKCKMTGFIYYPNEYTMCNCTTLLFSKCRTVDLPNEEMHPLDPLNYDEIKKSKNVVKDFYKEEVDSLIFNTITLLEPPKQDLLRYFLTNTIPPKYSSVRRSLVILRHSVTGRVFEACVNLNKGKLDSWKEMPENVKVPLTSLEDDDLIAGVVKSNQEVQKRCAQLGVTNMDFIYVSNWPIYSPKYSELGKPYEVYLHVRMYEGDNQFAHPLPFLIIVDLVGPKFVEILDLPTHEEYDEGENMHGNVVPTMEANYDYKFRPPNFLRRDDRPILISAPEGPSYKVKGNLIEWQNFQVRIGFNAREGLILYNVLYKDKDGGNLRPIMYRASVAEMAVFYGDPRPPFQWKNSFDEGDAGLGWRANELGRADCLGPATFFNFTLNNNQGDPVLLKNVVCVTEEDAGILWRHKDVTGKIVSARSHRLSLTFITTTGNYDIIYTWNFYQDASIQFLVKLTGIISTNMMAVGASPGGFGSTVFPQVNAQYHQHLVTLRLDTEIDGNLNSVTQMDVIPIPVPTGSELNPDGNGFTVLKTPMRTQAEGVSQVNARTGRVWVITNPSKIHPYTNQPVGWKLKPSNDPQVMLQRDSPLLNDGFGFLNHDIWVTRYEDDQLYPGGVYWNGSGLSEWVERNPEGSIENEDIVVWHMFNPVHIPAVEEFPVLSSEPRSVWLKPYNFFLENPAINVPPAVYGL